MIEYTTSMPSTSKGTETSAAEARPSGEQQVIAKRQGLIDPLDDHYWNQIAEDTESLRLDPHLLDRVSQLIEFRGYAGSSQPPTLVYVAMTSRLFPRPMNVNISGESAIGKNQTAEAAIKLHPTGAVHIVSAASPMAMVYEKENFQHRHIFFMEADSIPEDGRAGSAIRSLAADNVFRYSVVEYDKETGESQTRTIVKDGPTGLLTTTTKSLDPQLSTRMLEIQLRDDPSQTRTIMEAQAERVNPPKVYADEIDTELMLFVWLQEYLVARGEWRVAVPFAPTLSRLVPSTAVRMRRDFMQLLTCIQAVALLYQWQRPRTPEGWVEASVEDYGRARELLAPIFDTTAAEGLTDAVHATVLAIDQKERDIALPTLMKRLRRSKTSVQRRVQKAIEGGWLINDEKEPGYPARLRRGAPLPAVVSALPTVEELVKALGSTTPSTVH